ncbi:MAG: hypothetical protein R3B72_44195 [Polyangiaceae bacterium]
MSELLACPFCRELYTRGELEVCPQCDLVVKPLAELPPSHEAELLAQEEEGPILPEAPEDELLPWTYLGRGRGPLLMVALFGVGVFFAPWLQETSPEIRVLSGFEFSRLLGWIWAAGIAWFVMIPLILTRRSIRQMRGARVAVGFLASMVLLTVMTRLTIAPSQHPLVPLRYSWGWGLYAAGGLGALALWLATQFGGRLDDMPSQQPRKGSETLH